MQKLIKLVLSVNEIANLVQVSNGASSAVEVAKKKYDSLKEAMALIIEAKVEQGYAIPVKGSEEAKADWKIVFSSVYPKIADKKQDDFSKVEKSRFSSLNRAWNNVLIPSAKDKASCIDCFKLIKICEYLNIAIEDCGEINSLLKRIKVLADVKKPEGLARVIEGAKEAKSEYESEMALLIAAKKKEITKLCETRDKVAKEFAQFVSVCVEI